MAGTKVVICRHGPTNWNRTGRVQGHRDVPLSDHGRQLIRGWQLPTSEPITAWWSSPLIRAVETANRLGAQNLKTDDRLIEGDWGDWDGQRLADIRAAIPDVMEKLEAKGLDFLPPNGESPRMARDRLAAFLTDMAGTDGTVAVVCHKGVMRALYSLAVDWDMTHDPADKLRDACCHLYELDAGGHPTILQLNIPLAPNAEKQAW
ncbi:MAG: histidine phosphatase family protein [Alphaproteobacteria bacterium]|nr:histidine phosphatase family protein [Alphaproteobacteria bacterium SS10]MBV6634251.1 histidine phosphatase family protein [Alphaproteobacteria bacterium SS10]